MYNLFMKSYYSHFSITYNNPTQTLDEFSNVVKLAGAAAFRGQLEKSKTGTPHY